MTAAVVCAVLVGLAVVVEAAPGRVRVLGRTARLRRRRRRRPAGRGDVRQPDVAALMTEVAARLRAGAGVEEAWRRASDRLGVGIDVGGVLRPGAHPGIGEPAGTAAGETRSASRWRDVTGTSGTPPRHRTGSGARRTAALRGSRADRAALRSQVAALAAAVRLAESLGAPLADVLDRCAGGVAAAGKAESARRVALAGPISTARLLSGLPLVGVALGVSLGADPISTLLGGGVGTAAGLAGIGLLLTGRRWTSRLVSAARAAGAERLSG